MQRFDTEGSKISDKLKAKQQQKKKINNDDALLCKKDID